MATPRKQAASLAMKPHRRLPISDARWHAVVGELNLPARQAQILSGVLRAMTDRQIAAEMDLKAPTVRTYLDRICKRLGVTGRMELILRVLAVAEKQRCEQCPHKQ